jgi:deoxycytidylate deaminase
MALDYLNINTNRILNIFDINASIIYDACCNASKSATNSELTQKHGSIFIYNNMMITGYNHYEVCKRKPCISIHAEEDAINNFIIKHQMKGFNDNSIRRKLKKSVLLTVRIKNNCMKMSAPCRDCLALIKSYGIKQIIYSIDEPDSVIALKTNNLTYNRPSSGQRWMSSTRWTDTR